MKDQKDTWQMTYDEIYETWAAKFDFGSKGEMSIQEAKDVHRKWMRLGKEAAR